MGMFAWLFGGAGTSRGNGAVPKAIVADLCRGGAEYASYATDFSTEPWRDALSMAALALSAKNRTIADLQERLKRNYFEHAAALAASAGAAVTAAETQLALARCRELELRLCSAAAEQQRAVQAAQQQARSEEQAAAQARLEAERQAAAAAQRELATELECTQAAAAAAEQALVAAREQRVAIKEQLQPLKAELADAREAQNHATATLAQLDLGFAALRQEKEELQAMLTQRESAYLTLLETVQELFRQHSPPARSASGSGEPSPSKSQDGEGDVVERLQAKLHEWQQRLESAAKLRSTEATDTAVVAGFGSCHSLADDGRIRHGSPGSTIGFSTAHASQVQAAIEAAASEAASTSSGGGSAERTAGRGEAVTPCSSSSRTAGAVAPSGGHLDRSSASPRISAARPDAAAAAMAASLLPASAGSEATTLVLVSSLQPPRQQQQQEKLWHDNPLAARPISRQGSRIKQLGLQAAGSPMQQQPDKKSEVRGAESPAPNTTSAAARAGKVPRSTSNSRSDHGVATVAEAYDREEAVTGGSNDLAADFATRLCNQLNIHSPTRKGRAAGGWDVALAQ